MSRYHRCQAGCCCVCSFWSRHFLCLSDLECGGAYCREPKFMKHLSRSALMGGGDDWVGKCCLSTQVTSYLRVDDRRQQGQSEGQEHGWPYCHHPAVPHVRGRLHVSPAGRHVVRTHHLYDCCCVSSEYGTRSGWARLLVGPRSAHGGGTYHRRAK